MFPTRGAAPEERAGEPEADLGASEALLTIQGLRLALHPRPQPLVDGVSLRVAAGEKVALVGESGSGKSLTALSVLRLHDPRAIGLLEGSVRFAGSELLQLAPVALRHLRGRDVGMIFQEPLSALNPALKVGTQILEPLRIHGHAAGSAAAQRVLSLLARVGIEDPRRCFDAYPHALSGGQRQRAMIAMALVCGPRLLLADEPTTALDVTTQKQILQLLDDLVAERRMGLLLISHDLALVRRFADRVYVMQQGRIVESGVTEEILRRPGHPHTRALIESEPLRLRLPHTPVSSHSSPLVSAQALGCRYRLAGGRLGRPRQICAVIDADFELYQGETLGLVGESGSGKSSLARALVGLLPHSGRIVLFGERLTGDFPRSWRSRLQMVFQDPYSALSPRLNVERLITEGIQVHRADWSRARRRQEVERACAEVGLDSSLMQRFAHELSGGQRQRVAIARALVLRPRVLLLDEPTSALDTTIQAQLLTLLAELQRNLGLSYLLISHDLRVVRTLAHRVMVMHRGQIVESAGADQIFRSPRHAHTRELVAAAYFAAGAGDDELERGR
jgi:microcin C transport system ATP-binding protein